MRCKNLSGTKKKKKYREVGINILFTAPSINNHILHLLIMKGVSEPPPPSFAVTWQLPPSLLPAAAAPAPGPLVPLGSASPRAGGEQAGRRLSPRARPAGSRELRNQPHSKLFCLFASLLFFALSPQREHKLLWDRTCIFRAVFQ